MISCRGIECLFVIMKTYISPAIIMRVKALGETDVLVTVLTPERGQLRGVAKGARKSRKRFANCLETFSLISLEYGLTRQGGLCFIHSGKLIDAYPALRSDFSILSIASHMIELTEILFPPGVIDRNVFEMLQESLDFLARGERPDLILLLFVARVMALGGYAIQTGRCCKCGRAYSGAGLAVFKREMGGISCLKCAHKSATSPPLNPESVRILEQIQSRPLAESKLLTLTDEVMREIKPVIRLHREYRVDQRLKTSKYLD